MLFGIIFHYSPYEKFSVCLRRRWSSWAIQNSFAYITQGYYPASQNILPHHSNRLTLPQPLKGIMTDELFQNNIICVFMCVLSKTCKLFASHWFRLCGVKGFQRLCFKSLAWIGLFPCCLWLMRMHFSCVDNTDELVCLLMIRFSLEYLANKENIPLDLFSNHANGASASRWQAFHITY